MADKDVVIKDQPLTADPKADAGTPTGYDTLTVTASGQYKGSDADEKASLATVSMDKDHVINMGNGDNLFSFSGGDDNGNINGIVMAGSGNDSVYLSHTIADYSFSTHDFDDGIKIHFVGDGTEDGAAVTFDGFDTFVFRNIGLDGTNYVNTTYSYSQLYDLIQSHGAMMA